MAADDNRGGWPPDFSPEVRTELAEKAVRAQHLIRAATRSLVRIEGKRLPDHQGCGVLLLVGEILFLLTARHVADCFPDNGPLNVMSEPKWAAFTGARFRALPDDDGVDRFDATVYRFDPDRVTDEMRQRALRPDNLVLHRRAHMPVLSVLGYPASRFKKVKGKTMIPQWYQWVGSRLGNQQLLKQGHRPEVHIGLHYVPDAAHHSDGSPQRGPGTPGVSGSGIWALPPIGQPTIRGHDAVLAGIFTDQIPAKKPRYLLGTLVGAHVQMILNNHPELTRHFITGE
jgi:hypothetical protein